jgi:hypothetical protein
MLSPHNSKSTKRSCQKIPYFDKMFNRGWRETGSQSANLPDDDPKALKLLVGWVYGGKIEVPADAEGPIDILLGLSAMANKFALSSLADEAIEYLNAMMLARNWLPSASQMAKAYRLTPSGSKLRLLMSHICVFVTVTYGDDYSKSA